MSKRALRTLERLLEGGEAPGWPGGLEPGVIRGLLLDHPADGPALEALCTSFGRWYRAGRLIALPQAPTGTPELTWPESGLSVIPWPSPVRAARFVLPVGVVTLELLRCEPGAGARTVLRRGQPFELLDRELRLHFVRRPGLGGRQASLDRRATQSLLAALPEPWRSALSTGPARSPLLLSQLKRFTATGPGHRLAHPDLSPRLRPALDAALLPLLERSPEDFAAARRLGRALIEALAAASTRLHALWSAPPTARSRSWLVSPDQLPPDLSAQLRADAGLRRWWREHLGSDEPEAAPIFTEAIADPAARQRADTLLEGAEPTGLLIRGDNRRALGGLLPRWAERVRVIYIDPPYNTGLSFLGYPDRLSPGIWLSMMAERLGLARLLLRRDGALFASIDDREGARLKLLLGQLFSPENHLATLVWEKVHTRKNSAKTWSIQHEYIHAVARDASAWTRRLLPRTDTGAYRNPDADPRGPWKLDPITAHNPYGAAYTITRPDGEVLRPPPERYWAFSRERFAQLEREGAVVWGERGYPSIKRYLADVQDGLVPVTLLHRRVAGDSASARRALREQFGGDLVFDYPKPVTLLLELLYPASPAPDDVVLDYFAGSGATGEAVIALNRQDGGRRRFLLVERGPAFDRALLPRIAKALYAARWRAGQPVVPAPRPCRVRVDRLEPWEQVLERAAVQIPPR